MIKTKTDNQEIEVDVGLGIVKMNSESIQKALNDLNFLEDSILVLLNPEKCQKCLDIPYDLQQTILYLKDYFNNSRFDKSWVKEVFATSSFNSLTN